MDCGFFGLFTFIVILFIFPQSIYEFHVQYNFLSVSRRVNKLSNIFHNLCTKKKKKKKTQVLVGLEGLMRSMLKVEKVRKILKNNEIITITSPYVCARVVL